MLDELAPAQFDEWLAYYRVEPFGDEWLMAGTTASAAHNAGMIAAAAQGCKIEENQFKAPQDFVPKFDTDEPEQKYLDAATMEHTLRMMFPG